MGVASSTKTVPSYLRGGLLGFSDIPFTGGWPGNAQRHYPKRSWTTCHTKCQPRFYVVGTTYFCTMSVSTPDHLLLDGTPNLGPLIFRWELDNFKNCWNKSFRTFKILTLLYQQFSNGLISSLYLNVYQLTVTTIVLSFQSHVFQQYYRFLSAAWSASIYQLKINYTFSFVI